MFDPRELPLARRLRRCDLRGLRLGGHGKRQSARTAGLMFASRDIRGTEMAKGISLHIGLNRLDPKHYAGWDGKLNACENDARAMEAIAKTAGYRTGILLSEQATRGAVTDMLTMAARDLNSGDILLLTYSGHGSQVQDLDGDEIDALDETWCLYDGQMIDDELYRVYGAIADGVRVLILSDSCHSGTVAKVSYYEMAQAAGFAGNLDIAVAGRAATKAISYAPKFLPQDIALRTYEQNRAFYEAIGRAAKGAPGAESSDVAKASIRLISGCQDNQVSFDGAINSVFTAALLLVWANGQFKGNYNDFHLQIQRKMLPTQSPNHYRTGKEDREYDSQRPFTI
ncbi:MULTISPECIES: caspase family protein [unclassified Bradyrhizobium]|uniref:caspase family protein n=1 Tax=unclassified Bradyrhizobium TaxID=2631580 RepID=UPI002916C73D|nr:MULTISPECIES: caspase family protein [unclassified Bradyrhizobium]